MTEIFLKFICFIKCVRCTGSMHFPIQPVRCTPFQKTQITTFFCQIGYVTGLLYIEDVNQFHTLFQPKVVFQELNHVLEIPKFHIIKSFVLSCS